jgi:hypothetical protein
MAVLLQAASGAKTQPDDDASIYCCGSDEMRASLRERGMVLADGLPTACLRSGSSCAIPGGTVWVR